MRNFHIKSLVLGLGIGMILTSTISIVYLAGIDPASNLSEEQIVKLAERYGMVKSASLIDNGPDQQEQKAAEDVKDVENDKDYINNIDNRENQETQEAQEDQKNKEDKENKNSENVENAEDAGDTGDTKNDEDGNGENTTIEEEEIEIRVNPGDSAKVVANKLVSAGLISNKDSFIKQVKDLGLSGKIRVGQFKIKKGADIGSIIQTLTSKKKR